MIYGWKRTKGAMPTHLFSSFNLRRGFFSHRKRAKGYLPVLLRNKRRGQFRFFFASLEDKLVVGCENGC